jgi:hypothetical protein
MASRGLVPAATIRQGQFMPGRIIPTALIGLALATLAAAPPARAAEEEYEFRDGEWVRVAEPAKGSAAGELEMIRGAYQRGHYSRATRAASRFVKRYPTAPEAEEAMLLAARAWRQRGFAFKAYEWLDRQLAEFPNGRFAPQALELMYEIGVDFLHGKIRWGLGFIPLPARSDGETILNEVIEQAPTSALARRALLEIASYHYDARH